MEQSELKTVFEPHRVQGVQSEDPECQAVVDGSPMSELFKASEAKGAYGACLACLWFLILVSAASNCDSNLDAPLKTAEATGTGWANRCQGHV